MPRLRRSEGLEALITLMKNVIVHVAGFLAGVRTEALRLGYLLLSCNSFARSLSTVVPSTGAVVLVRCAGTQKGFSSEALLVITLTFQGPVVSMSTLPEWKQKEGWPQYWVAGICTCRQ
eukprot:6487327-Amphidinium_carterae.1